MPKGKYTVILIPDEGEETKEFLLSRRWIKGVIYFSIIVIIGVTGLLVWSVPKAIDYNRVNMEHESLKEKQSKVVELIRDLNRMKHIDNYIRNLLGVDLGLPPVSEFEGSIRVNPNASPKGPVDIEDEIPISYLDNIPTHQPVDGFITQEFDKKKASLRDEHHGIDIAAKEGTGINASASGMVVFSGWTVKFGYLIIIFHGDDYFSLYGHNQANFVENLQWVDRGQLIALVGQTGDATGPHLHFEIWKNGKPVDPSDYVMEYNGKELKEGEYGSQG